MISIQRITHSILNLIQTRLLIQLCINFQASRRTKSYKYKKETLFSEEKEERQNET